jgi:hypothetical protein
MEIVVTTKEVEYIPGWNKNRESADPVQITLRFLNTAQRSELIKLRTDREGRISFEPERSRLIIASVVEVKNLTIVDRETGERQQIKTGQDILEGYGLDGLALELISEIMGMNPRDGGVEKNSSLPSHGTAKA